MSVTLPMKLFGEHYGVEVTLDDHHKGYMLLDTGAELSVLQPETADNLGLQSIQEANGLLSDNQSVSIALTDSPMFSLETMQFRGSQVGIFPLPDQVQDRDTLLGVLGMDILEQIPVLFDFPGKQFSILDLDYKNPENFSKLKLFLQKVRKPTLNLTINSICTATCILDIGSRQTILPQSLMSELNLSSEHPRIQREAHQHYDHSYTRYRTTLESITIDETLCIDSPEVVFQTNETGLLGIDLVRQFQVLLDAAGETIYFG